MAFPARQEHQVGRFLCVPEERLARRAHPRTHGQTADEVNDLGGPRGHWKVRLDFSCADRLPEATLHHRHGAGLRFLEKLPDLGVVDERSNADEETPRGPSLLGRALNDVPEEAREGIGKGLRREECLQRRSALPLCVGPEDAQEQRPLVPEDRIQAWTANAHPGDEIVDRYSVVALRPEHLDRSFQSLPLVEAARSPTRPGGFVNHLVQNSSRLCARPDYSKAQF